jgi:hypothetical protein
MTGDRATWNAAIAAAEAGRPNALADLLLRGDIPTFARERMSLLIRRGHFGKLGRPEAEVPTGKQARQWEGKKLYKRFRAGGALPEWALERVKAADKDKHPNAEPFSDATWKAVFKGKRDEWIDPAQGTKKHSLAYLDDA